MQEPGPYSFDVNLLVYTDMKLEQNQVAGFLTLLRNMIQTKLVNQQTFVQTNGAAVIGALLQKVRIVNEFAQSVVPDYPGQSAQANNGRHFVLLWNFLFEGNIFLTKVQFWEKMLSLISLYGLHRLILDDT
ncbi:hypothetical protein DPMN_183540 [Dreissena polymorpha]|uniref:Uncharacterized protein n=1 Tax=Dreissena polymorpha TaxID=45954 RepID=A0A9D4I5J6_DREPO|nr:hypothetical protein DPMN_183540 [Dreissena polymorpha]